MRHILLCTLLCLVFSEKSLAQRGLFWLGGFELGGNVGKYNFKQNGNILDYGITPDNDSDDPDNDDSHRWGKHNSINSSLYYRFSRRFGVEAGLMRNYIDVSLRDSRFQNANKDYNDGSFTPSASYTSRYLAAHYYLKDRYGLGLQLYFGGGVSFNHGTSHYDLQSYYDKTSNETLALNGSFAKDYISPFLETGLFFYNPHKKFRSFLSFKYTFANGLFSGNYQATQNNNLLYQDAVAVTGNSFTVSFKTGISLTKPKEQLYTNRFSARHHTAKFHYPKKHDANKDVVKAQLLGCFGEEKSTQSSFWLYENKTRYFLEKLDSNLNRSFVKELNLKSEESGLGKHDWVYARNIKIKDEITLFTISGNAESTYIKVIAHQFALTGRENRNALNVFRIKGNVRTYSYVAWSTDSSKVSIVLFQPKSKLIDANRIMVKTYDQNLNLLNEFDGEFPSYNKNDTNVTELNEINLNNRGELFMIADQYEKKIKKHTGIWIYKPQNKKIYELKFDLDNVSTIQLRTDHYDETSVLGFYTETGNSILSPYKGVFYGLINTYHMRVENLKTFNIPLDVVQTKGREDGLYKFVSVINHPSGVILNSEELRLASTSSLLASLDNDGKVKFIVNAKYVHSFRYYTWYNERNKNLNFIINERRKNLSNEINNSAINSDQFKKRKIIPIVISIDSLGNQSRKLLLTDDESKTRWIPSLSHRTENGTILLTGKNSGKYRRRKLKLDTN